MSMIFKDIAITNWLPNPRKRKAKQPKDIPVFTSGLETKLMNCIGKDARKVIVYLSRKINPPTIEKTYGGNSYTFRTQLTYRKILPFNPKNAFDQSNIFDTFYQPPVETTSVDCKVKLEVLNDGTLHHFVFQMGGSK